MAKIKLTKNELKTQRDALKRFQRFLPTLQLKKQQLQMEVRQAEELQASLQKKLSEAKEQWKSSIALFAGNDYNAEQCQLAQVTEWRVGRRNVAGVEVPVFDSVLFAPPAYDLFEAPLWLDEALEQARSQIELSLRSQVAAEMAQALEQELRIVSQRVNLFEKVKIPETKEAIRKINIALGDQQTNSVGRSKIAKGKCAQRDAVMEA